jgi:hypothetical protein
MARNMNRVIARILHWWHSAHPDRTLERVSIAYADAVRREDLARRRNDCQAIGRAKRARKDALHSALRGGAN